MAKLAYLADTFVVPNKLNSFLRVNVFFSEIKWMLSRENRLVENSGYINKT